MAVLDRTALEESPLADLHVIARELGIDGFRRLRKAALVDAIVERQGGDGAVPDATPAPAAEADTEAAAPAESSERPRRARTRRRTRDADEEAVPEAVVAETEAVEEGTTDEDAGDERPSRRSRSRRSRAARDEDADGAPRRSRAAREDDADGAPRGSRRSRSGRDDDADAAPRRSRAARDEDAEPAGRGRTRGRGRSGDDDVETEAEAAAAGGSDTVAEGTVELLGNGSGFLRVSPPDPSDDDVYISAAQVRRCELVSGDTVTGPVRAPRRSERYPSLVRVDTINGRPADEVAEGTPFDELPAAFPTQRFALGTDDATLKAIEWLTPLGRGSRVAIAGASRSGKTEALRRLAGALAGQDGLEVSVVLAGARPEEIAEWKSAQPAPVAALSLAASPDAQVGAIERAIDTAKRVAARGGHAVVLIDSLSALAPGIARRTLAAARDIVDGGSLTIVAVADEPVGGETTVIALDVTLTSTGRFPALDLVASGTLRPELLVGAAGADAIAQARASALG
jgi:transcription termination factor Rho